MAHAAPAAVRRAAPYAARSRDYYRSLSASSVGIELAVSVIIGMFFGRWLDGRIGTALNNVSPQFTVNLRAVWEAANNKGRGSRSWRSAHQTSRV